MTLIWPAIERGLGEVWLGGVEAARDHNVLQDDGIKTLVCCNPPLPHRRFRSAVYLVFDSNAVTEGRVDLLDETRVLVDIEERLALSCPGAAEHSCSIRFAITRFLIRFKIRFLTRFKIRFLIR